MDPIPQWMVLRERVYNSHPARGGSNDAFRRALAALEDFRFWNFGWRAPRGNAARPLCECGCCREVKRAANGHQPRFYNHRCAAKAYYRKNHLRRKVTPLKLVKRRTKAS